MSFKYASKVDETKVPQRFCIDVGNEVLVFATAKDAAAAFAAIERAIGKRSWERVTMVADDGAEFGDREYMVIPLKDLKLDKRTAGMLDEVCDAVTWKKVVKCDGTGVCGCWRTADDHVTPDSWQEYEHEGTVKHMCETCQTKDIKFTKPQPSC